MGNKYSLIDVKEQTRIDKYFNSRKPVDYHKVLRESKEFEAKGNDRDMVQNFRDFIRDDFKGEFEGLFGNVTYDKQIATYIKFAMVKNAIDIGLVPGQQDELEREISDEIIGEVAEDAFMVVPIKGTRRKWDKDEDEFVLDALRQGRRWQDLYVEYLAHRLSQTKIGRTKKSFSSKYYRFRRKVQDGDLDL